MSHRQAPVSPKNRIRSLLTRAGAPGRSRADALALLESLEGRLMLAGDHPSFDQVFNTTNPLVATLITLDGGGAGTSTGNITPAGDNDVFRFTAPANDFVTIWADALTNGSTLDSRVEVWTKGPGPNNPPSTPLPLFAGSNNGTLTSGVFKDGWVGFKAVAGTEYFIVIKSDLLAGVGSIGTYTVRVDALTTAFPALNTTSGAGTVSGNLALRGSDIVYKVTTGAQATFLSDISWAATADPADFDPRLEVYDVNGVQILRDDDTGAFTDSFGVTAGGQNKTYYVRLRGDQIGDPASTPSTGAYTVNVDASATRLVMDPVTRQGGRQDGTGDVSDHRFYQFQAQGTGLTIITLTPLPPAPIPDSAIRLYNNQGVLVGFNELTGAVSRLEIQLTGGITYWIVIENFNGTGGGLFDLHVESHHTYDPTQPIDDHQSTPNYDPSQPPAFGSADWLNLHRLFDLATPVVWSAPQDAPTPPFPNLPAISTDHAQVVLAHARGRIHNGADTDLFQFVPPTDMLGEYAGHVQEAIQPGQAPDPPVWEARHRPSTRLQLYVNGGTLLNAQVRIYDSNFALIYGSNDNVLTLGPDPAGGLDPASFPPELPVDDYGYTFAQGQPADIEVWGGEVYYLEVRGGGAGLYDVEIQADAPSDTRISTFGPMPAAAGAWNSAYELRVDPATGESRNYVNAAGGQIVYNDPFTPTFTLTTGSGFPVLNGRSYAMNLVTPQPPAAGAGAIIDPALVGNAGSRGRVVLQSGDFGNLTGPTDADLYQFRALYSGYVEVWVNTTQITDEFLEGDAQTEDGDPMTPPVLTNPARKTKTYNSPLDSALRIFNNDFQEVVYNNDNGVTNGEAVTRTVGSLGNRTFWRRDARVVFQVESGKNYFIQVESGQRNNFSLVFPKVDWRHGSGTYEILVNSMPNLNFADDHINAGPAVLAQATPIPIDLNNPSTTAVIGSAIGELQNVFSNPSDSDLFTFISPGRGTATITVSSRSPDGTLPPSSFNKRIQVYNAAFQLVTQRTTGGTGDASVNIQALVGDRFFVVVDSGGLNQDGAYTVKISGIPHIDDYSSVPDIFNAFVIDKDLYDFDRTETVPGTLETPGDTDVFTFDTIAFDVATITVTPTGAGLTPTVDVYEISEDPDGNPILLHIATNATGTVSFSVTAPPRTSRLTGNTFNSYFVVVGSAQPFLQSGGYELRLDLNVGTDDHPDDTQWELALSDSVIPIDSTGAGAASGIIEQSGDTDIFSFTAAATGQATVLLTSPANSLLFPRLKIYDENHTPVLDLNTNTFVVTGPDTQVSTIEFAFSVETGHQYFIVAAGVLQAGNTFKTSDKGAYTVGITAPIADDHPNLGEWASADTITLSGFTGQGSINGQLEYDTDTDLFTFVTLVNGDVELNLLVPQNTFRGFVRVFDAGHNEVGTAVNDGGPGDEDGVRNGRVIRTLAGTTTGQRYFVVVSSDQTEPPGGRTGFYIMNVIGERPPTGPDDYPDAGQWEDASGNTIDLSTLTGDGSKSGHIDRAADTDLFSFFSIAGSSDRPLKAFVQVLTPQGSTLDVGVRIFKTVGNSHVPIISDDAGIPGSNALVTFDIDEAGAQYFVQVDGLNGELGDYTINVDTQPGTFTLFYPEGFSNNNIREYVSIGNSNPFDVHYTIRLRFEDTSLPELVIAQDAVIGAGSRGGITISDGPNGALPGVPFNKAYAIVIESDAFLAANISHYDFNSTLGEAFTSKPSTEWTFAKGSKLPGQVADFLLYYNPNPTQARVTLTIYRPDGTSVAMSQVVEPFRRLGWNFNATALIPVGDFAFTVTSEAANPGDEHIGIIAALSHYDRANNTGYGVLGDAGGGSTVGIVPELIEGNGSTSSATFFNNSDTDASVTIIGRYIGSAVPNVVRTITLGAHQSTTLTGTDFALVNGDLMGLRYDSSVPITVIGGARRLGATDSTQASTEAATDWFWGDAFMNSRAAGSYYFEDMYFYNPDNSAHTITLNFTFNDGVTTSYSFSVGGKDFSTVALHQLPAILNHRVFNWFSIEASSDTPFVAKLTHYDLVLNGGWGTKGAPLGPTTPLNLL